MAISSEYFFEVLQELEQEFANVEPELAVELSDPKVGMTGYVVVWNTPAADASPLGKCAKGGTRITPNVSLAEIKMLARTMALKNAAAGLPLGGAKSGLRADSDSPDIETVYKAFVRSAKPLLVEHGGIFGGFGFDIGAKPIHARWACEELGSGRSFTGKPVEMGGSDYDNEGIAGLGVAAAARVLVAFEERDIANIDFAVQGLGAMGAGVFRYFVSHGAFPRFISDIKIGGSYELESPLPYCLCESIISQDFQTTQRLLEQGRYRKCDLEEILYVRADILFPCAGHDVITSSNAGKIKAKCIVEGANNPCSEEVRSLLFSRGIKIVPDFIANPGGIIAAYVEMTSEISPEENAITRSVVQDAKFHTEKKVSENTKNVLQLSRALGVEPAQAGKFFALTNIFAEYELVQEANRLLKRAA